MEKKLFLDDIRNPIDCTYYISSGEIYLELWDIVRSYNEFIDYIELNGVPDVISFDHDLADEHYDMSVYSGPIGPDVSEFTYDRFKEKTGYDCAKWLCNYCIQNAIPLPKYYVHSMNPIGKENIEKYLENCEKAI